MSLLSREALPTPQLAGPPGLPNFEDGKRSQRHQMSYWVPSMFAPGKIEVVVHPDKPVREQKGKPAPPDLTGEVDLTVLACGHPEMRKYYAALGVTAVQQRSPSGKVILQEVTTADAFVSAERFKKIADLDISLFNGTAYSDQRFFDDMQSDTPSVTSATQGVHGVHDLLAHNAPAWGFAPKPVINALGDQIDRRLAAGDTSTKVMYTIDQAMGVTNYGAMVLGSLWGERGIGYLYDWDSTAGYLNNFVGQEVVTPDVVANHVHNVLDAAQDFVAPTPVSW